MILLAGSAIMVGVIHSLAPGHWLPVVMLVKSKRWSLGGALLGSLVAASGHILVSIALGVLGLFAGAQLFLAYEAEIERYSGLGLIVFGVLYAAWAWKRHSHCHSEEHHHPAFFPNGEANDQPSEETLPELQRRRERAPLAFLFLLGLSPCVAVLPVFVAAAPLGIAAVVLTMLAFALGVVVALAGATLLVTRGVMNLDHPWFEHHGDVLTGGAVALMGLVLFLMGGKH